MSPAGVTEPVTLVLTRRVRPGREAAFEDVLRRIAAAALPWPGHEGVTILRPEPGGRSAYTVVVHFRSAPELQAWLDAPVRATLVAEADTYCAGGIEAQRATGLEAWFRLPGASLVIPPPRIKMALLAWVGILPVLLPISLYVAPRIAVVPLPVRLVASALVITFAMTYVVMPLLVRLARTWLYPPGKPDR